MRKNQFIVVVVLLLTLGGSLYAVTFGEPDGNRHPYVGTIIFQRPGGYFSCSATLMSPTVLLTAGHCTSGGGAANLKTWISFQPSVSLAGSQNYSSLGSFLDDPNNGWILGQAIPHPQFNDFAEFPAIYDVGVILLNHSVSSSTYGALPPQNFLETLRGGSKHDFTIVGYGLQGLIKPFFSALYQRFMGTIRLVELNSTYNGGMTAKFTNNPGVGGGTCLGDSGGPIFFANTNMVVAVVSFGTTPCIGIDYNFRTDTALAQDFLESYIP